MIKTDIIFKYRIKLSKSSTSITQHEFRRVLREALINSGLKYAQNKNMPKFSLGPGAAAGEASVCEYADICLREETAIEDINLKLSPLITGGFKIEAINEVPYAICSVESLAQYAGYTVKGLLNAENLNSAKLELELTHDNGMRELIDIKPHIYSVRRHKEDEAEIIISLPILRSIGLAQMLEKLPGLEVSECGLAVTRSALLWCSADGSLRAV